MTPSPGAPARRSRPEFWGYSPAVTLFLVLAVPSAAWTQARPQDISALSLEQLAEIETTTATRAPTALSRVPAAIFVITQEDIRRSGATSIPDALRLAPGVQVARI